MPREQFALTAIFVALHGPIYFVLSKRGAVLAISLAKYPFLFYLVALRTGQEEWWWPALGSVYFFAREALEEIFGVHSRQVEVIAALGLVLAKAFMRVQ